MAFETLLQRIDERLKALGISERKACLNANVHVDTIRRIRNRGQSPRPSTLSQLAEALGVPDSYFLEAAVDKIGPAARADFIRLQRVHVKGFVQGGVWRDAIEWPIQDWYSLQVPSDDRFPGMERIALEVRGNSMDRLYPEGTIVVCVSYGDIGRGPKPGERVICLRRGSTGDYEATIKEYQLDDRGRHVLWPRSSDPEFQQPIILPTAQLPVAESGQLLPGTAQAGPFANDGMPDDVVIAALVIQSVRRE